MKWPRSHLGIWRPGPLPWLTVYAPLLLGSLAIWGGRTATQCSGLYLGKPSRSNIRLWSAWTWAKRAGTRSGSQNRNDDRQTETFPMPCSVRASRTLRNPSDMAVVGLRSWPVPKATMTLSCPLTAPSTSDLIVALPQMMLTFSATSAGKRLGSRTKADTLSPAKSNQAPKLS